MTAALLLALAAAAHAAPAPEIEYRVRYRPGDRRLEVRMALRGLGPVANPAVALSDWGGWQTSRDPYLSEVSGAPGAVPRDGRFKPATPVTRDWQLEYRLAVQEASDEKKLERSGLPVCGPTFCRFFSVNTLMRLESGPVLAGARRRLTFDLPPGWRAATGWGRWTGKDSIPLDDVYENGVILIGSDLRVATAAAAGTTVELWSAGVDAASSEELLGYAASLYGLYSKQLGAPGGPPRIFVAGMAGDGTCTAHGLEFSLRSSDRAVPDHMVQLLSHELFHLWLGIKIRVEDWRFAWLQEGLTDYVALWGLWASGIDAGERFGAGLADLEHRALAHPRAKEGVLARTDIEWRKPEWEDLAYAKGAIVAFAADAELRRRGQGTLFAVLKDLAARGREPATPEAFRAALARRGLGAQARLWLDEAGLPPAGDLLTRELGFELSREPRELSYLGLSLAADGRTVEAVDPDGPAADAGVRPGDELEGWRATRNPGIGVGEDAPRFAFGLTLFHPGREVPLTLVRDGETRRLVIAAGSAQGGFRMTARPGPKTGERLRELYRVCRGCRPAP
ncbi:MAG: hypothetical protein HY553_15125 [Elusimicrobia bacterium]|nr:hypothetical protein [Elusimicrobiota bacterium]